MYVMECMLYIVAVWSLELALSVFYMLHGSNPTMVRHGVCLCIVPRHYAMTLCTTTMTLCTAIIHLHSDHDVLHNDHDTLHNDHASFNYTPFTSLHLPSPLHLRVRPVSQSMKMSRVTRPRACPVRTRRSCLAQVDLQCHCTHATTLSWHRWGHNAIAHTIHS